MAAPFVKPKIPVARAKDNKWLIVGELVTLNPLIEKVVCLLDPWFEKYQTKSFVTSGFRSAADQLRIIKRAAIARGIDRHRPEITHAELDGIIEYQGEAVPVWAPAWNELLCDGFLVNPPFQTKVLIPYFHPSLKTTIPKGQVVNLSTHQQGRAIDVGGSGGKDKTIKDELIVIQDAFMSKEIPEMKSITPENTNNCVHVTLQQV